MATFEKGPTLLFFRWPEGREKKPPFNLQRNDNAYHICEHIKLTQRNLPGVRANTSKEDKHKMSSQPKLLKRQEFGPYYSLHFG